MRICLNHVTWVALALALASGCVKKGSGTGTRAQRPDFSGAGTISDPGGANQKPPTPPGVTPPSPAPGTPTPPPNPTTLAQLAGCFNLDQSEVKLKVSWSDATAFATDTTALCKLLNTVGYPGIKATAAAIDIDK